MTIAVGGVRYKVNTGGNYSAASSKYVEPANYDQEDVSYSSEDLYSLEEALQLKLDDVPVNKSSDIKSIKKVTG